MKLRGPDYKGKDPQSSLDDFKARIKAYESAYVPLGDFEEKNGMQYIKLVDVGRKVIQHRLNGFLSKSIANYLSSFNLAPRQIWITRHGQSLDNLHGKIGGDSSLTEAGRYYSTCLYNLIEKKRREWYKDQKRKINDAAANDSPLQPGDETPPYPESLTDLEEKNFCVWTSMLKRSMETAEPFDDDSDYDTKAWEYLNEIDAGNFEGMTYPEIQKNFPAEYAKRKADKLSYIYPGVGGEGYLHVIQRLNNMINEIERIKDHVLIIGHRAVCRVLVAYFMEKDRNDVADLDIPLGMVYVIEPKPYGLEFHAYRYNEEKYDFDELPGFLPERATSHTD